MRQQAELSGANDLLLSTTDDGEWAQNATNKRSNPLTRA